MDDKRLHPVTDLIEAGLPKCDFAILDHGFAPHGRDYWLKCEWAGAGTFAVTFTHVVDLAYRTRVRDDVWPRSWSDEFTDYAAWEKAGEPDGYIFGTNWSLAYPGIVAVEPSVKAEEWSSRLGKPMCEGVVETDRFQLDLVFHSASLQKLSSEVGVIDKVIFPL